jgi:hypothetical protein
MMPRTSRGPRALLLAAALLVASLGASPAADAASSGRCRSLAGKMKVIVKGKDSMVVSKGSEDNINLTFYGCLYVKPRLYKLPEQNGGDTELLSLFTPAGRYLAYAHVNAEEASPTTAGWIEMVDLKRRKKVFQYDAFPSAPDSDVSSGVNQILLRADGAVAWIGYELGTPDKYSVQTALPGQAKPAEVDQGTDVGKKSLRRGVGSDDTFSWLRGGVRKEAAFGGPTVTPAP